MEEIVSVLIWECWFWEDIMDMIDWVRLLLAGFLEIGVEGRRREVRYGFCELNEEIFFFVLGFYLVFIYKGFIFKVFYVFVFLYCRV